MEATGLTGEYEIVAMVSIHASVMEATQAMYVNGPVPVVSIHASVMEATTARGPWASFRLFRSTPP